MGPSSQAYSRDNILRGVFYICASGMFFVLMNTEVKWLSTGYPVPQLILFRSAFGLIPAGLLVLKDEGVGAFRTKQPISQILRASLWVLSFIFGFLSLKYLSVADSVVFSFTTPLFIVALSGPMLGEKADRYDWLAVLFGFAGLIAVVRPSGDVFSIGAVYALGSAAAFAGGMLGIRYMVKLDSAAVITFYTQLTGTICMGLVMPFVWVTPSWPDLLILASLGLIGGLAQLWNALAIRYAPMSVVGPFVYTQIVWAVLFDFVFWGAQPSWGLWAGVVIIMLSTLSILYRRGRKTKTA